MHNQDEKKLDNKSIEKKRKKNWEWGQQVEPILPAISKDCRVAFWVGTEKLALQPATNKDH